MADINDQNVDISLHSASDNTQKIEMYYDSDLGGYRVPVQALIDGGTFSLQPFTPVITYDSTGTALTTSWTTIVNYSGTSGSLDFIAVSLGTSNYKVRLTVDGSEVYDIAMSDLNTIGLVNAVNVNIWAETALKNFRYRPLTPVDFTTSLKIEIAMTTGTGTAYWLVNYRVLS